MKRRASLRGRAARSSTVTDETVDICDELSRFSDAQAALLTSRGLVYLTDLKLDGGRHGLRVGIAGGDDRPVPAAIYADAQSVARARSRGKGRRPNGPRFPSGPAAEGSLVRVSDRIAR